MSSINIQELRQKDQEIHAFLHYESRVLDNASGPLAGVPIAIKDNLCLEGMVTTAASRMLEDFVPPYTATAVQKVLDAGAVVVGKTNLDEFALGSSTENSAFGPTKNPHDLARVPGGSSGGSAAAVAAGMVDFALGSDTGGSIRQPAALCGVVGLKPTYGAVSRYGLIAFASSLDVVGPITKTVVQNKQLFDVIKGRDPRDATSGYSEIKDLRFKIKDLRIGLPKEYFGEGLDHQIAARIKEVAARLERAGATVVEISLPNAKLALPTYYVIAFVEVSSNLARYDGIRFGHASARAKTLFENYALSRSEALGDEAVRRIILGTFASSAGFAERYYHRAQLARQLLKKDFQQAFSTVDLILTPTTPTPAFRLGEKMTDPLQLYLCDVYTVTANLVGVPALSVPVDKVAFDGAQLPVGAQLIGNYYNEDLLFEVGKAIEKLMEE